MVSNFGQPGLPHIEKRTQYTKFVFKIIFTSGSWQSEFLFPTNMSLDKLGSRKNLIWIRALFVVCIMAKNRAQWVYQSAVRNKFSMITETFDEIVTHSKIFKADMRFCIGAQVERRNTSLMKAATLV